MKQNLFLSTCLTLIAMSLITFNSCNNDKQAHSTNAKEKTVRQLEAKGQIAYKESNDLEDAILNEFKTRNADSNFPDFFGGIYLDENFDINLVVKGNDKEAYKSILEKKVKSVPYHIKQGQFSLNELYEIQDKIDAVLSQNPPKHIQENITTIGIRIKDNRIIVELKDISEGKVNEFKKGVIDSPAIIFEQNTENIKDLADINPGTGVVPVGTAGCSVGYRAWNSANQIGFVSSGHAFTRIDQGAKINNVEAGRCKATLLKDKVDAAFIVTNSSYTPTAQVGGTSQLLTTVAIHIREGAPISLKGINTFLTSGVKIQKASDMAYGTNGVRIYDLIRVGPAATKGGDSGGIVYDGSLIFGIIKGVSGGNTFVVKASNINSAFNLKINQ